ncbi:M81 family metallopeptidase [Pelagibius litoralis]|uniref:Microcystinase C n=1 Tax=Pelagibius litoralis TaxID=374515 RepID=A0A967F314_9PROT|nr:M81 family metallopeptidase [Pelagibius litoralis]NIA72249.1 M81 family metallopeptidase [Pelagibius litoralis]
MTFRVLTAEISHETNTFSVRPTDLTAFENRYLLLGEEAIHACGQANTDLAGFLDVARTHSWRLTNAISASAPPGGRVTSATFRALTGPLLALARAQPFDGVLLALHGAMVAEDSEDGEGEILAHLRAVIGSDIPIAITLDPHANVTDEMAALADIIVSYKTYPHVDMRERAVQAGQILHRAMAGKIAPRTLCVRRPMLEEINGGRTDAGPMIDRLALARAHERHPDAFAVSINAGFGNADIAEVGPTVLVTYQGDPEPHRKLANQIADDIWDRRAEVLNDYLSVEEAAAQCAAHDGAKGPIVVADYADNPGGGAYGDATGLLAALLDARVGNACFGPLIDPEAVRHLEAHAAGDSVTLSLGGKTDPGFGGGPITVTGRLKVLSEGAYTGTGPILGGLKRSWGPTAVLVIEGIEILIVSNATQLLDLEQFRAFGIDPTAKTVVALKSMQHFRAAFEPIAARVIVCDSGALCTPDLRRLPYRRVRRPIFPLDG